jgi:hypothetical protein
LVTLSRRRFLYTVAGAAAEQAFMFDAVQQGDRARAKRRAT